MTDKTTSAMTAECSQIRICSHCGLSLPEYGAGLRYFGTHIAHQENDCLRLLRNEIDQLRIQSQRAAEATARAEKAEVENVRLREYLQFYAYHEHWMVHANDDDYRTVLVAHKGDVSGNHGWCAAEQALTTESKS